jgi:hypothetical protein
MIEVKIPRRVRRLSNNEAIVCKFFDIVGKKWSDVGLSVKTDAITDTHVTCLTPHLTDLAFDIAVDPQNAEEKESLMDKVKKNKWYVIGGGGIVLVLLTILIFACCLGKGKKEE